MTVSDPLLQAVCAVLVLALPLAVLLLWPPRDRADAAALAIVGLGAAGAIAMWAGVLGLSPDAAARSLDAAIAAGVAVALGVIGVRRLGPAVGAIVTLLWAGGVLAPVLLVTVGVVPALVQRVLGAVDFAGVLATHVAGAAAVVAVQLVAGRGPAAGAVGGAAEVLTRRRSIMAAVLLTLAVCAWMLGVERVLTAASGRILLNAMVGCVLGGLAWWLVAIVIGRERPAWGVPFGAALGWGAVGSGAAFLSPMALAATALLGTAAGAAVVLRRREGGLTGTVLAGRAATSVLVAVAVGGTVTALLADGFGLAATGSIAGVGAQLAAIVLVAALTVLLMMPIIAIARRARREPFRWAIPDSN